MCLRLLFCCINNNYGIHNISVLNRHNIYKIAGFLDENFRISRDFVPYRVKIAKLSLFECYVDQVMEKLSIIYLRKSDDKKIDLTRHTKIADIIPLLLPMLSICLCTWQ